MGRPIAGVTLARSLAPERWPGWALTFPGGIFPDDRDRQAERLREFHTWRTSRDTWRREYTDMSAAGFLFAARTERRRRARALADREA